MISPTNDYQLHSRFGHAFGGHDYEIGRRDTDFDILHMWSLCITSFKLTYTDSKIHGANMGPTWVLSAPDGPHVGPHGPCNEGT